jgi:hypothetical protein
MYVLRLAHISLCICNMVEITRMPHLVVSYYWNVLIVCVEFFPSMWICILIRMCPNRIYFGGVWRPQKPSHVGVELAWAVCISLNYGLQVVVLTQFQNGALCVYFCWLFAEFLSRNKGGLSVVSGFCVPAA